MFILNNEKFLLFLFILIIIIDRIIIYSGSIPTTIQIILISALLIIITCATLKLLINLFKWVLQYGNNRLDSTDTDNV